MRSTRPWGSICLLSLFLILGTVHNQMAQGSFSSPRRDINAVLRDHERKLLAIKNVVGVYVGLEENGRGSCLRVMLLQDDPETRRAIPFEIEGYRVISEITGQIRPLPGTTATPSPP